MSELNPDLGAETNGLFGAISRRDFVRKSAMLGAAAFAAPSILTSSLALAQEPKMAGSTYPFKLPPLDYAKNALMPYIDEETMTIHHDKHHQGYVNGLNKALEGHDDLHNMTAIELVKNLDKIPAEIRTAVRNMGGGHVNHSLFWKCMTPKGGGEARGTLAEQIQATWKGFRPFADEFTAAAGKVFGSGWAWLVVDNGKLKVTTTSNQDTPWTLGQYPVLGIDVWEHAYYLKYQNRRKDYITAWMNVVDWGHADGQYVQAMKG
jgi:Fe-Mn family superoxide dismutase